MSSVPNGHQAAKRHGRSASSGEEQNLSAPSLITSVVELRWLLNSLLSNRSKCDTQNYEEYVQERIGALRLCAVVLYRVNQTASQPRNHTMKISVSCPLSRSNYRSKPFTNTHEQNDRIRRNRLHKRSALYE